MESAWALRPTTVPLPLVVEVLPLQYDSMFAGLTDIHKDCDALEAEGIGRPLSLVIGDIYGVVASMFRAAGADVATTDTRPSEVSHIPHHQGSSSRLQDAGFDLVIVLENGSPPPPFNKHSKPRPNAPYLATETPAVGQYSNNSCPVGMGVGQVSQLVFPWDHGTKQTHPIMFNLSDNIPQIQPTCVTTRKNKPLADFFPSHSPDINTSQVCYGIALAMALQWTPLLIEWRRNHTSGAIRTVKDIFDTMNAPCAVVSAVGESEEDMPQVRIWRDADDTSLPEVLEWVTHKEAVWINKVKTAKSNRKGEPIFPRATHVGPAVKYEPWLHHSPRLPLPIRPTRHVRNIRGKWKPWQVVKDGPEARQYGWVPLPDSINIELDMALNHGSAMSVFPLYDDPMPSPISTRVERFSPRLAMISEIGISLMNPRSAFSHTIASADVSPPLYHSMYKLWDRRPPSKGAEYLGLGATTSTPAVPPLPRRLNTKQLALIIKERHKHFVRETDRTL